MLEIRDIVVCYDSKHIILDKITMSMAGGKIHGLVGSNGSGKTTLLGCIKGIVDFQQGSIHYNGVPVNKSSVSLLETHNYFYKRITGKEYLEIFKAFDKSFDFDKWNELFDLPLDRMIDDYSTGMKKKLAFMSILSFNAPIIILDEPFNGVDMETVQMLKVIVRKLKERGRTIIITSHILESLTNVCDTISYLNSKKIEKTFYPSEFSAIEETLFNRINESYKHQVDDIFK